MNKDEIQLQFLDLFRREGCGLVMNKDEIQRDDKKQVST